MQGRQSISAMVKVMTDVSVPTGLAGQEDCEPTCATQTSDLTPQEISNSTWSEDGLPPSLHEPGGFGGFVDTMFASPTGEWMVT